MRATRWTAAAGLSLVLVLGACGDKGGDDDNPAPTDDASGPAAAATVNLKPTTFDPSEVTVKAGETVSWKWGGGVQHDVEGDGFKSKVQSKGQFTHTFDEAGTFDFHCNVHPTTMKGTVTVEA
jgi:plastocyanin